ncbi:uncharacterized protein UHOR_12559 [Ustilago hordei]|uniref:Reverse transcriptase domain-containing protein n=1 Tax=Ustilago hordei TaxID=120017 RepID=I2FM63_USTHO|nr:uncharacterized protein UHOR_12559 [Ustilago hordei]
MAQQQASCRGVQPVLLLAEAIPAPSFQPQATTPASSPPPPSPVLAAPAQAPSAPVPLTVEHVPQRDVTTDIDALHARLDAQANFSSQLAGSAQLTGSASSSRPVPSAPTVTPAQLPQASTPSSSSPAGELQLHRLFPWISPEVAQLVYDNRLPPHNLGKLRRASKSRAEPDTASGILVNGIRVQPALPSSDTPDVKRFLRQIPDVCTFAQAWTAYTALRCASTSDSDLCASLSSFLVAVIDHDTRWHWPAIAEYVLTVCEHRFGYASAGDWAIDDLSAWQKALGGIPHHDVSTSKSPAKPSTAASSTDVPASSSTKCQHHDLSGQTQVQLVDTVVDDMSPRQTQVRHLTSVPAALDVPSADWCLSLLFDLRQHLPPVCPNTTLELDAFDPTTSPARIGSMQLQLPAWERLLLDYPDKCYCMQMAGMIQHGCLLGYDGPLCQANHRIANLPIDADGHAHLRHEITTRLAEGRLTVVPATSALVESPIGVIPKPRSVKLRTIHHLSHPQHPASLALSSVNASINPSFVRIQYESVHQLVDFVRSNPNCLLWKGDLEDAFCHVVMAESDAYLLSFQYDGVCYCENALTFGGSSSPFLFNLVAEFLHWVVASCLPNTWPVNHYLDDTFGTVPAEAAHLALLPVHTLALASTALGLRLLVKKTFTNLTHLEKNIQFLEALAVLEVLHLFAPLWSSPLMVVVHVDNENIEHGLRSGSSHDPLTQKLLREIFGFCFTHNFTLHPPVVLPPGTHRPAGQPPPTFASSMGITLVAATLLWNGLAPSTRDRAGGTVTAFRTFCAWHFGANIACLPATSVQLLEWLGSMSSTSRSYHSTKHELSHLHSHHVDLGLSLAGFECGHLEWALCGYKHVHGARCTGAKLPITLPLLRCLVAAVDTFGDLSARDRAMFKVAFTLSFACFLRSGEVVWDRHTDPAIVLRVGSVKLAADHAVVTLPASKMDPFCLGVKVVAPLVGGPECPITHLCCLLSGHPSSAPLFGLGPSGADPLPCSSFIAVLQHAIAFTGLAPSAYASHSFRRGTATWAAHLGASPKTIQCLGHWNSDCFRHYVDCSAGERRDLSVAALFSIHDGPLVPDSTSWQDVGAT